MLDFLFGEGQYGFRFLIAFIVVLALLGLFVWLLRRFGAERLGGPTARGRQPRLAVIDAAAVDGRRRLVLIRRDNVEHLIMIGGPSDIVIEPSIVRAAAARDVGPPRAAAAHGDGAWMPQPEPAAAAPAMPRIVRPAQQPVPEEPMQWHGEPEPPPQPRQNRAPDPLAGLAAELSRNPPPEPAAPPPPQRPMRERPREAARDAEPPRPPARQPQPAMPAEAQFASPADQNLAEMAQRLEAALRRPVGRSEGRAPDSRPDSRAEGRPDGRQEPKLAAVPQPEPPPEHELPPPDRREPRAAAQGKSPYDSLEQEMASLLGRNSKA